jgi:uncharacterized protein with HEPN domain
MSKREDILYLGDMLEAARRAYSKIVNQTRAEFELDRDTQDIVIRMLQIVGEAARHMPESARQRYPEIEWSRIVGMRHRLVHDYFKIDLDIVWTTAVERLPPLIAALDKIVPPASP